MQLPLADIYIYCNWKCYLLLYVRLLYKYRPKQYTILLTFKQITIEDTISSTVTPPDSPDYRKRAKVFS